MIAIVNYGLGNVNAFANVYKNLNIDVKISNNANELEGADKIILPGVGSFDHAMELLNNSGMREMLDELVLGKAVPIIGICVGMQMLAKSSEEGVLPGLGWIDGEVKKVTNSANQSLIYLPQMGWNNITPIGMNKLLKELSSSSYFYFLHSYCFHCSNLDNVLATTDYGEVFASIVNAKNVYGVQFHPEKSHSNGIQLLRNFAEL
jgi:imidazole glycerol-phosphate synthase subunit HisH